jgi:glycosyltransferase involved in cell wall biosynthesis
MTDRRISVIVPNRNMGHFLADAFGSIQRQSVRVDEVLLVDAGSTDESLRVAEAWRARGLPLEVIVVPDASPAQARNAGLEKATGAIIGFLDADDLFPPGKLEAQIARLEREPRVDAVSGYITWFEQLDPETLAPAAGTRTHTETNVNPSAHVLRRQVFDTVGVFDEAFLYSEDTDFVLRMLEAGVPISVLRQEVLYYRRHAGSLMSQSNPRKLRDFHRVLALSIKRRAALGTPGDLPRLEDLLEPASPEEPTRT